MDAEKIYLLECAGAALELLGRVHSLTDSMLQPVPAKDVDRALKAAADIILAKLQ